MQEAGTFGITLEMNREKDVFYIFTENICSANASGSFLQTCINFVEQRLKFSHFEGKVIP